MVALECLLASPTLGPCGTRVLVPHNSFGDVILLFLSVPFYEASPIIGSQKILVMLVVASALDSTRSSWGLVKGLNC